MDSNIFQKYKNILEEETLIQIEELESNIVFNCPEKLQESIENLLEEEYFEYEETASGFILENCSFDELLEIVEEYDFSEFLTEASAKRKIVIRGGRRKIIFKCPPGFKRVKRNCIRRPSSELSRLRRRARKAARKSKGKRARAIRRRKVSLKRRRSLPKTRRK